MGSMKSAISMLETVRWTSTDPYPYLKGRYKVYRDVREVTRSAGTLQGLQTSTDLLGSYLASRAKLASFTQMSAKVHMRSTKGIKLSASVN